MSSTPPEDNRREDIEAGDVEADPLFEHSSASTPAYVVFHFLVPANSWTPVTMVVTFYRT